MVTWFIIGILACILIEGFFSGSETGIISVSRIRVRHLVEQGSKRAQIIERLLKKPDRLLATTLVGTNIAMVTASALATTLLEKFSPEKAALYATLIMSPLVLIFAETIPKTVYRYHADRITLRVAYPLRGAYTLLYPIMRLLSFITSFILRLLKAKKKIRSPYVTREELQSLVRMGRREGVLETTEEELIHRVLEMEETTIDKSMISREKIVAVREGTPLDEVLDLTIKKGFVRIPVYGRNVKHIVGIVHVKDLLSYPKSERGRVRAKEIMHSAHYTSPNKTIRPLLNELRQARTQMAIVVDKKKEVLGLVTVEDLLEEIVGEIEEEYHVA
jgi:CBS domain containing-hemolysin-like protein